MLRRSQARLCASVAPAAAAERSTTAAQPSVLTWEAVKIPSWRQHANTRSVQPPEMFHVLGATLGPRPLLVLNTAQPPPPHPATAPSGSPLEKWLPSLTHLNWRYGCISIPFFFNAAAEQPPRDWLDLQCEHVLSLLDTLSVRWTHCIGHGSGALVAARLASKAPDRIGSILSMDSPLLSKSWMKNEKIREEIALAEPDVNVPTTLLEMQLEELATNCETPLECVSDSDTAEIAVVKDYLFSDGFIFRNRNESIGGSFRKGYSRDDSRYLSCRDVAAIRHPFSILYPAQGVIADVTLHKDVFNIRRVQPIKSAKTHSELFAAGTAAEEVGTTVNQWLTRFEPDVVIHRRIEQGIKESKAKLDALGAPPAAAAGGGSSPAAPGGKQPPAGGPRDGGKKKGEKKGK